MKTMQLKISKRVTPLALAALLIPAISSGFPNDTNTYQIISETVTNFTFEGRLGNDPANDPSDPKWSSATATPVPLEYLILASANAQGAFDAWEHVPEQARNLSVTSIHDNQEILFRVSWDDATEDVSKGDVPLFFDALAVMIPYPESDYPGCVAGPTSEPMIHMGMRCDGRDEGGNVCTAGPFCKCCPVNLHFWRPDKEEVENIVTNGMGTTLETAETDDPTLFHAAQSWDKGKWTVIMGRALKGPPKPQPAHPDATDVGPGGHMVTLRKGESYDVVWANWDGARDERNGSKFIGLFGTLIIAP